MIEKTINKIGNQPILIKGDYGYFLELEIVMKICPEINIFIDDKNRRKAEIDIGCILQKDSEEKLWNLFKLLSKEGEEEYKKECLLLNKYLII